MKMHQNGMDFKRKGELDISEPETSRENACRVPA